MLNSILKELEDSLPPRELDVDADNWPGITQRFSSELKPIVTKLLKTVSLAFPRRLKLESKSEFIITAKPSTKVSEFRLRPEVKYFTNTGRRPPQPEDKRGDHATGIEVSFVLFRGYQNGTAVRPSFMSLDFQVWGLRERVAFGELLRDHRYIIEKLLLSIPSRFFTSCVFENLDRAKKKRAFDQLCLYYENQVDPENFFSLQSEFGPDATEASITSVLLPIMAIYDASMGYCLPRKRRDRILEYLALMPV